MKAKHADSTQMNQALSKVNERYQGNIAFERFEPNGRSVVFTLRVKSSREPGARRSFQGRRMAKACWHAHGHFFEALLAINPEVVIISKGGPGSTVDKYSGNWSDCNIGSQCQPLMFSQACDCGEQYE